MQGLDSGWRLASFFSFFFSPWSALPHSFSSHSLGLILRAVRLIPNPQTHELNPRTQRILPEPSLTPLPTRVLHSDLTRSSVALNLGGAQLKLSPSFWVSPACHSFRFV
jgi:hypothetical protein